MFEKLDNFDPDNEDIFQWLERNKVQPIQKDGPKNALEYLTPTEIQQQLSDDLKAFSAYKNPTDEASQNYYGIDDPKLRMDRIVYHGENISALEQALQTLDPDSFREYSRTKPKFDSKILPFKDLNAEGGRVGFSNGSFYDNILKLEDEAFQRLLDAFKYYREMGGKKDLRDYLRQAGKKGDQFRGAKGGIVGLRI